MKNRKKEKTVYVDDGHTVFNMDGVGGARHRENKEEGMDLTRAERRAVIRAAMATYLPILAMILLCFGVVLVAMYFWLMK